MKEINIIPNVVNKLVGQSEESQQFRNQVCKQTKKILSIAAKALLALGMLAVGACALTAFVVLLSTASHVASALLIACVALLLLIACAAILHKFTAPVCALLFKNS